ADERDDVVTRNQFPHRCRCLAGLRLIVHRDQLDSLSENSTGCVCIIDYHLGALMRSCSEARRLSRQAGVLADLDRVTGGGTARIFALLAAGQSQRAAKRHAAEFEKFKTRTADAVAIA